MFRSVNPHLAVDIFDFVAKLNYRNLQVCQSVVALVSESSTSAGPFVPQCNLYLGYLRCKSLRNLSKSFSHVDVAIALEEFPLFTERSGLRS